MTDTTFETVPDAISDQVGQAPAAPSSVLAGLRAKREAILTRTLDLPVPGYDGTVFVRYKPVTSELIARGADRAKKAEKQPHLGWESNAMLLAASVVGVYAVDEQGQPVLVDETFSAAVAEGFGEQASRALDVVRIVYVDDLAIGNAARRLTDWSGLNVEEAIEEFEGN